MVIIGVDPHKSTHTASALDPATHRPVDTVRIDATLAGYRWLLAWAKRFGQRRWAVENACGLGRHLVQWLIARGEAVVDVPSTATARVRELSRGGRRKNDTIDAAAASVAALHGDAMPVPAEDHTTVLALLDERRASLSEQRTRTVNQLHAVLRDLIPGGARTDLTARQAAIELARVRPASPVERARKELARELIADIRSLDAKLQTSRAKLEAAVKDSGSRLTDTDGIGPVMAGRSWPVSPRGRYGGARRPGRRRASGDRYGGA